MNVDTLGAIAEASGESSRFGGAAAGDEFEGVLRQTLGAEQAESERAPEASAEDAGRDESADEDPEAAAEHDGASAEDLSDAANGETRELASASVFAGELGFAATGDQQALAAEAGAVQANARGSLVASEEESDEPLQRNSSPLSDVPGAANDLGQRGVPSDELSSQSGRGDERTAPTQIAEEFVARDQAAGESRSEAESTSSVDKTEFAAAAANARNEFGNEARSEAPASTAEQNSLSLEGANTGDRQERDSSEDTRTASPADLSRENLAAEARTESNDASAVTADRGLAPGFSTGAEAAPTNPVTTPLVAAPLAVEQAAAPGSPIPPPAADAVAVQTEWLVSRGGGSARLVLHPQELGEVAIRVTVRDGVVDVVMVAQESAAKAIAEQQGDRLTQAFANRDLRMENFEVRRGDAASLGNEGDPSFREPGGGQGQSEAGNDRDETVTAENANEFDRSNRAPVENVLPQIVSIAPASGVDLRI